MKIFQCILLGLLLLSLVRISHNLADIPAKASPPITGIPIDEELAGLLKQIVPYDETQENALPKEKRFLFNLNKLINEDLKEQSVEYKQAVCKIALRMALAINKTVDSIEVRLNPFYAHKNVKDGSFVWALGSTVDREQWKITDNVSLAGTCTLFTVRNGKIINIYVASSGGACGGEFSECCVYLDYTVPGLNDVWFQHFVDLGREEDFPIANSEYSPKIIEYMIKSSVMLIESIDLRWSNISPENTINLTMLKDLQYLTINFRYIKDADEMRKALLDLSAKIPKLQIIEDESQISR